MNKLGAKNQDFDQLFTVRWFTYLLFKYLEVKNKKNTNKYIFEIQMPKKLDMVLNLFQAPKPTAPSTATDVAEKSASASDP